jgi:cellulose synthase (UDP-forming)
MTRRTLEFEVTPKGASNERRRGRTRRVLSVLAVVVGAVLAYATAGTLGWVPWRTGAGSTVASGIWLALAGFVLLSGARRIRSANFATSRRNAHRVTFRTSIEIDDIEGDLVDVSVGGAAVRFPVGTHRLAPSRTYRVACPSSPL